MYVYVTFPSLFSCIVSLVKDLAALVKSTYFDSCLFILIFCLKKKHTKRWSVTAFSYKKINFVRESWLSQDKNFFQIAPF